MSTYTERTKENKSQPLANGVSQKKSRGETTFQLVDNRSETAAQKKLQEIANNYTSQQNLIIQKKEPIQLKGDKHYWVKPANGAWTYVGSFKNHAEANKWWKANKADYPEGEHSQGNAKKKFK